jgi:hypothetical protein
MSIQMTSHTMTVTFTGTYDTTKELEMWIQSLDRGEDSAKEYIMKLHEWRKISKESKGALTSYCPSWAYGSLLSCPILADGYQ